MTRTLWWILDRFWPTLVPESDEGRQAAKKRSQDAHDKLEQTIHDFPEGDDAAIATELERCTGLLDEESNRRQSIDTRLTTIIGFSSIASTVVFSTILTVAPRPNSALTWSLLVSLAYMVLQLIRGIRAAIVGLERKPYKSMGCDDLIRNDAETAGMRDRRLILIVSDVLTQNRELNNRKIDQLALAHDAAKNFVGGLAIFTVLAGYYHVTVRADDALVNRLKTDRELRELLRGPQGPPGRDGLQGPAGNVTVITTQSGAHRKTR